MTNEEVMSVIKSYNSIFQYADLNTNLVVCQESRLSLKCLSLDVVEIYVYMLIQRVKAKTINCNEIQWHYMKVDEKYVFYAFPNKRELSELFSAVAPCVYEKDNKYGGVLPLTSYVCCADEIELCASCKKEGSSDAASYPFEADILLTINKNERSLEDLNFLSQVLCYLDLELTFSFLDGMGKELGKLGTKKEQKALLAAIKEFINDIDDMKREVAAFSGKNRADERREDQLDRIVETCELTAEIFRFKRQKNQKIVYLDVLYSDENLPDAKVKNFFENARGWNRKKRVKRRSCDSILSSMEKKLK